MAGRLPRKRKGSFIDNSAKKQKTIVKAKQDEKQKKTAVRVVGGKKKRVAKSSPRKKILPNVKVEQSQKEDDDDITVVNVLPPESSFKNDQMCVEKSVVKGRKKNIAKTNSSKEQKETFVPQVEIEKNVNSDNIPGTSSEFHFSVEDIMAGNSREYARQWHDEDLVSETTHVSRGPVKNILHLLDQECTVPFIVRYRSEKTGNLAAEKVREIELSYENVKSLRKRVDTLLKSLSKQIVDPKLVSGFLNAKSIEEVEYLYAPFKSDSKRSLAERARKLGLEPFALDLLEVRKSLKQLDLKPLVKEEVAGVSSEEEMLKGIQNIIADTIAKDREILDYIHHHPLRKYTVITSSESTTAKKKEKQAYVEGKKTKNFKFENYFNFNITIDKINAHQVMAINRGESLKTLSVKILVQRNFKNDIQRKCWCRFFEQKCVDSTTKYFLNACIEDAYNRLLEPRICRQFRSDLTKKAEKESVNVFCDNLKRLLLTPPVRGRTVIGIDPGYTHGCKVAVVSSGGEVLHTDVIYPHNAGDFTSGIDVKKFLSMVSKYNASTVAIGNGTACRAVEAWLSNLIKNRVFHPHDLKYCIVNENGASIYSITEEAEADLPGLLPNLRSAVSISRRLQDPLLEYVKVEPKHLGVGMYQHDVPEAMLKSALDSVVVECVSFVGVDLNVCPLVLLRKISGLSAAKAKQIIEWREKNGHFINRQQLLEVKGLGPKSFEQCAGFVKILPQTSYMEADTSVSAKQPEAKRKKFSAKIGAVYRPNFLDMTVIHPESYNVAQKLLKELDADSSEIGQQSLVEKVSNYKKLISVETVAEKFGVSRETMQLIIDALSQPMEYDIRAEFEEPLFQTGVKSMNDIAVNQVLTGRVNNVTNFGAFVDIGVGQDGLVHISKMRSRPLQLGDRVSVKVLSVDVAKKRIGLEPCYTKAP